MKKRLLQTNLYYKFIYSVLKEESKTFENSSCKKLLLQRVFLVQPRMLDSFYNVRQWMFFIPNDNGKTFFFIKVYRYYNFLFSAAMLILSLKNIRILDL